MKILVTGATGFIGQHIIKVLADRGHKVVGAARGKPEESRLRLRYGWMPVEYNRDTDMETWLPRLKGASFDVVINAVGILRETGKQKFDVIHEKTPRALFKAAVRSGVKHIIQISALGAEDGRTAYSATKRQADDYLLNLGVNATVLRPSVVYGPTGANTHLFMQLARLPVIPLVAKGDQMMQPLHVDELCEMVTRLAEQEGKGQQVLDIVGSQPVSLRDLLTTYRHAQGLGKPRYLPVPYPLVYIGAWLGDMLNLDALSRESLAILMKGNTSDVAATRDLLGRMPMGVNNFFPDTDGGYEHGIPGY